MEQFFFCVLKSVIFSLVLGKKSPRVKWPTAQDRRWGLGMVRWGDGCHFRGRQGCHSGRKSMLYTLFSMVLLQILIFSHTLFFSPYPSLHWPALQLKCLFSSWCKCSIITFIPDLLWKVNFYNNSYYFTVAFACVCSSYRAVLHVSHCYSHIRVFILSSVPKSEGTSRRGMFVPSVTFLFLLNFF